MGLHGGLRAASQLTPTSRYATAEVWPWGSQCDARFYSTEVIGPIKSPWYAKAHHPLFMLTTTAERHPCKAEHCVCTTFLCWRDRKICASRCSHTTFFNPHCARKQPDLILLGAGNALISSVCRRHYVETCPESLREQMTNSGTELSCRALLSNTLAPAHFSPPANFHLMHALE